MTYAQERTRPTYKCRLKIHYEGVGVRTEIYAPGGIVPTEWVVEQIRFYTEKYVHRHTTYSVELFLH